MHGPDPLDDGEVLPHGKLDGRDAFGIVLRLLEVVAGLPAEGAAELVLDRRARREVDQAHALPEGGLDTMTQADQAELQLDLGRLALGRQQLRHFAGLLVRAGAGLTRATRAPHSVCSSGNTSSFGIADGAELLVDEGRVRRIERVLLEAHPVGLGLEPVGHPVPVAGSSYSGNRSGMAGRSPRAGRPERPRPSRTSPGSGSCRCGPAWGSAHPPPWTGSGRSCRCCRNSSRDTGRPRGRC